MSRIRPSMISNSNEKEQKQKNSLMQKGYMYTILNLYVNDRAIIYAILYSTCERGIKFKNIIPQSTLVCGVSLQICIRKALSLDLVQGTSYFGCVVSWFSLASQCKYLDNNSIRLLPFPFGSFQIHHPSIFLSFDAKESIHCHFSE